VHDLQRKLGEWTGRRWMVVVSKEQGAPTMRDQAKDRDAELRVEVLQDPLVKAVLAKFPGATVGEITRRADEVAGADGLAAPEENED
jgi:DNA polymerase-3 subunit gamma/tau